MKTKWVLWALGLAAAWWLLSKQRSSVNMGAAQPIATTPYGYSQYAQYPQQPWVSPEAAVWGGRTFTSEPEDVQIVSTIR